MTRGRIGLAPRWVGRSPWRSPAERRRPAPTSSTASRCLQACAACHTEKPDALGPSLKGVIGRKSAARDDFRYSGPLRRANLTWDEATLKQFLADPQAKVPGTRMPFGGLGEAKDVDDVVAYLATLK